MSKSSDALQAFDVFTSLLAENKQAVTAIELKYCQINRRAGRFSYERLQNMRASGKTRLGNHLIAKYRKDEGIKGAIDWDKFNQWCRDHWRTIVVAKVILTILFLFCL